MISEKSKYGVFVDTLSFTIPSKSLFASDNVSLDEYKLVIDSIFVCFDIGLKASLPLGYGGRFYKNSCNIEYSSSHEYSNLGKVFFDGNKNSINFIFTGEACEYLNIHSLMKNIYSYLVEVDAKITRIDTAIDFHSGEFTINDCVKWYENGEFNTGGRTPKISYIGSGNIDFLNAHERTLYIGSRQSTKYFRMYEKGHQLGDLSSKWTRLEIEYKSNNGSILPLDMIIDPSKYLLGSYDAIENNIPRILFQNATPDRIKSNTKLKLKLTINELKEHAKKSYGRLLNLLHFLGENPETILAALSRSGLPSRVIVPDLEPSLDFQDYELYLGSSCEALPI